MKRFGLYFILFCIFTFNSLNAKNLQANFQHFTFQNRAGAAYIETYFSFLSTEIQYETLAENAFQGSVLIELSLKKGQEIIHFDKYLFKTPVLTDTLQAQYFLDKQIYALNHGEFELELKLQDPLSGNAPLTSTATLGINCKENKIAFSDLMVLDSYELASTQSVLNKSGYELIPSLDQGAYFLDDADKRLDFYIEWYNTQKDSSTHNGYLLHYYIENEQSHKPITGFNTIKRKTKDKQRAFLGGFDLTELPSGNYNLVVALLDKEGVGQVQKRVFFQRRNSATVMKPQDYASLNSNSSFVDSFIVVEQLAEYISALFPVATQREWAYATNQLKNWDLEQMKQFFYGFWYNRNPIDPERVWLEYLKAVNKANEMYGTIAVKGFATNRGRVYLQYGTPDYIENSVHENYTLPYQIWTYYKIEKQTNEIFIFVENALGTNDYELIHSTMQGEKRNDNWRNWIYRERGAVKGLDNTMENRDIDIDLKNDLDEKGNRIQQAPGGN